MGVVMTTEANMTYLNNPSVRTDRSCRMNQWPSFPSQSLKVKAFTVRLPIRFLVNMPFGGAEDGITAACGYP